MLDQDFLELLEKCQLILLVSGKSLLRKEVEVSKKPTLFFCFVLF